VGRPGPLIAGDQTQPRVTLRPATEDDAGRLLAWRNDPDAVRFSVTGLPVDPAGHAAWIARSIADPGTRLWIAEDAGTAVGQVRVDIADAVGTVSIGVAPDHRGRGIGTAILLAMVDAIEPDESVRTLRALVHPENAPSLRVFERAGFNRTVELAQGFLVLERPGGTSSSAVTRH